MSFKNDFNIFVGGTLGTLKGIKINSISDEFKTPIIKNFVSPKYLSKKEEIKCMEWSEDEAKILLGTAGQTIKVFDTQDRNFETAIAVDMGKSEICGVCKSEDVITAAATSGFIKWWSAESEDSLELKSEIDKMRKCPVNNNVISVGGNKTDLQLWDLFERKPIFIAKNVKPNELQLEVPVWVSDIAFLPASSKVAVSTRYGQVRLYDPKSQRRPVLNVNFPEESFICISAAPDENGLLVGSGKGNMFMVDLRMGAKSKTFKGHVGSIRSIVCCPTEPYVVSVGLDRHLLLHHIQSTHVLHREYLQSRLNCALVRSNFLQTFSDKCVRNQAEVIDGLDDSSYKSKKHGSNDSEDAIDDLFNEMETVQDKPKRKKMKC